jgi:DNA-binding CsgD family transcriptional regulator
MYSDGDQRQAVEHSEAAAALLDESDPALLAYTLLACMFFGVQTGRGVDQELLERALELEQRAGRDGEKSSLVLIWHQCTDAHEAARERHRLEDEWYRDRGDEIWRAEKRAHLALVELRAGNWELARTLLDQSCAELEPVGTHGPLGMPFWTRARLDAQTGRIDQARAALLPMLDAARERSGSPWFTTFVLETLGFMALTEGDLAAADRAFVELEELLESIGVTVPLAVRPDADHVEAVVGLGDVERARRHLARFEERAARSPRLWTEQALPRVQALIAAAEGDPAGVLAILEQAPVVEQLPFEHARNLLVQGSLQRRLKQKRAAADTLEQALETFDRLGSPDWARRTRDELSRVGLRRGDPYELTETERRVAELVASGMTNREVAQAAFVSPKTVEANLARVYRKLGIHSRAELGAAMSARQA